jgi:hypothetical protein
VRKYWKTNTTAAMLRILFVVVLLCHAFANRSGAEHDWPMWRYDAARSAQTPQQLAEKLHLQWVRQLPEPQRAWPHQWDHRGNWISTSPIRQW